MLPAITVPFIDMLLSLPGGEITAFAIIFACFTLILNISLIVMLKPLKYIIGKTQTTLDDRILKAFNPFLPILSIATSLWLSIEIVYSEQMVVGGIQVFDAYIIILLAIIGLVLSSVADALLVWYGFEIRPRKNKVDEKHIYPFVRNVIKIGINVLFLVFILQRLGFDTTAIITGLGIGGIAVALALQDTLANFFGGLHILIDKPFKQFDYIRLDSETEGTVKEIGWRTTRLSTVGKDEIIIPNSKLAGSTLKNFSTPKDDTGVTYVIGVDYREDIDKVEKVIQSALSKVSKNNPNMGEEGIWLRFDSFGEYSLNFKFGYLVRGYTNQWGVWKEVSRELFYAFKNNDIKMPYPITKVIKGKE